MNTTYKEKINKLPKNIQDILLLNAGDKIEYYIYKKNNIIDNRYYLIADVLSKVYFKEISLEDLLDEIKKSFKIEDNVAKKLTLDLVGMRILPIKDYLKNEDFEYIIHSLGGDIKNYKKFIDFTKEAVEKELKGDEIDVDEFLGINKKGEVFEEELGEVEFNVKKEKEDSLKIFESSIKQLLVDGDRDILENYNTTLLELMLEDRKFKKDLEISLYNNKEILTASKFRIDGKEDRPTISNWLKDFIKTKGTDIFTNFVISDYLTESDNAKNLYTNEKVLISKLLQLYRNLKFFPESQKGLAEDDWEIIPAEEVRASSSDKKIIGPPKTEAEKNIEKMVEEAKVYKENSLEKLAIEEEIEHEKKIEELRFMATKFAEGSLERKAIEEELRKMEHKV